MDYAQIAVVSCTALGAGMVCLTILGHRLGRRRLLRRTDGADIVTGPVEGAVFALLGLLIAFNFAGAYGRLDARRDLIVEEVNAIGTAYLRLDLLPAESQPALREKFRTYVDSRVDFYHELKDRKKALEELARASKLQDEIWTSAVAASRASDQSSAPMLLLPALNEMIDITTTRTMAVQTHPPLLIVVMLFALALICAGFTGQAMAKTETPSLVHVFGFAVVTAFMIYVILDIDYPRVGLVRLDAANDLLVELRRSIGP